MGVRKVLGASSQRLFILLSTEYFRLVVVASFAGTPVAWYAGMQWLREFPFRIRPSWELFLTAGLLCLTITLLTISFQAIRTVFVNPARQLRTD